MEAQALPTLCRLSADTDMVSKPAISAMINLCADELPQVVEELLKRGIVDRLVEVRLTHPPTHPLNHLPTYTPTHPLNRI